MFVAMSPRELRALKKLLDYNREDEEDDFELYEKGDIPRNHIVHSIRTLDKMVRRIEHVLSRASK
jgi:hypothetical protein